MKRTEIYSGVLLDEQALTIDEFACACAVEVEWVVERVQAGFIEPVADTAPEWRFASRQLARARRMVAAERMFDANQELAALMADLLDELHELRRQLQARSAR